MLCDGRAEGGAVGDLVLCVGVASLDFVTFGFVRRLARICWRNRNAWSSPSSSSSHLDRLRELEGVDGPDTDVADIVVVEK